MMMVLAGQGGDGGWWLVVESKPPQDLSHRSIKTFRAIKSWAKSPDSAMADHSRVTIFHGHSQLNSQSQDAVKKKTTHVKNSSISLVAFRSMAFFFLGGVFKLDGKRRKIAFFFSLFFLCLCCFVEGDKLTSSKFSLRGVSRCPADHMRWSQQFII
ncbi:hypothetical protein Btru_056728 [Bulinus truncatus]|nr:hypothetical protein Btru_056728 [Bulinus truncatus]